VINGFAETALEPMLPESDELRLLRGFADHGAHCVVIGGYAVRYHGFLRPVGDIDLVLDRSAPNLRNVELALQELGVTQAARIVEAFAGSPREKWRWREGHNDHCVDLLASADPFSYTDLARDAIAEHHHGVPLMIISKAMLIATKRAALADPHRKARWKDDEVDLLALLAA